MSTHVTNQTIVTESELGESRDIQPIRSQKRLFDEFRTRNVKIVFGVLFALAFSTTVIAVIEYPFTGDIAFDLGYVIGFVGVSGSIDLVVAAVITVIAKSVYLGGRRGLAMVNR